MQQIYRTVLLFLSELIIGAVFKVRANPEKWNGYGPEPPAPTPHNAEEGESIKEGQTKGHWDKRLSSFQKLLFTKAFHEDMVRLIFILIPRFI